MTGIFHVAIAPGRRLVGADGDFGCVLWQPDRATNPETPIGTGPHCQGQFFTASGQLFTISSTEIRTPDSTTATAERRVQAPHLITQAAFSLDGSVVAVASEVNDDPEGRLGARRAGSTPARLGVPNGYGTVDSRTRDRR